MNRLAVLACACLVVAGCQTEPCTEIGCFSTIVVDYGDIVATGPYNLYVSGTGVEIQAARCNDPASMEALDNPEGLECDSDGFTYASPDVPTTTSVDITVVRVSDDEPLVPAVPVTLTVAETMEPNGPDCPPKCFSRHGTVVF